MKRNALLSVCTLLVVLFLAAPAPARTPEYGNPVVGGEPQRVEDTFVPKPEEYYVSTWVEGLEVPWSLVFLSEEKALVTERSGRVRLIENGRLREEPYAVIGGVVHTGEAGLMGIAKHPEYPAEPWLYVMHTCREGGNLYNQVIRYRDTGSGMELDRVVIKGIPGNRVHNGGRIASGPDGMLYVTTGDVWQAQIAQDPSSLGGKILRLAPDGSIPPDNPFEGSPVYSLGHRNPQGLAWHPETGDLFSSEHGPSGEFGLRGRDIVNVIEPGGNYGWPLVLGDADVEGFIDPLVMWEQATPPSGMAFWDGRLFVATLRSRALVRIALERSGEDYRVTAIDRFFARGVSEGIYGRLRDVVVGPDCALYVLTSNRDGRGSPAPGDDRILRLTVR